MLYLAIGEAAWTKKFLEQLLQVSFESMAVWGKACKLAVTSKAKQIEFGSFENVDPELCVQLLRVPSLKNFSCLHHKLKTCKSEWLKEFVNLGGLTILLGSLDTMDRRETMSFMDAFTELECVRCVKEVMNSETGLNAMMESQGFVCSLARGKLIRFVSVSCDCSLLESTTLGIKIIPFRIL